MWDRQFSPWLGYPAAAFNVAAALALTQLLHPHLHPTPFLLFFAAVVASAWLGGLGPGIVATVLSDLAINYFFLEPTKLLAIGTNDLLRLSIFTLVTVLTSSIMARRMRAEQALREEQQRLEKRVRDRTAEISQANEALREEIGKRKETETFLAKSEEQFRRLAENIQEVFWLCDPEIREIYYISPAYETVWGRTCQSLYDAPRSFIEAIHPEDREQIAQFMEKEMRNGFDLTFRIVRPDGGLRWIRDRAFPVRKGSETVDSIAGIAQDVTDIVQSQEILKRQAEIIDQIHDSVVSTDLDGYVTSWNKGAERLFGYSLAETLNRHISFVYPESEQAFLQREVIEPLKTKHTHEVEVRMQRKSGDVFHAHLALSLLRGSGGAPIGMIGYSMDITTRKRAEQELQSRIRQQAAIAELGQRALVETRLSVLMNEAVKHTADVLQVDYTKILELLPNDNLLLLRAGVGWKPDEVGRRVVGCGIESQAGYTLHSHEPVIVSDLATEPRFQGPPLLTDYAVRSGMSVIIGSRERPFGVLGAHTIAHRTFSNDDVNFLQAVANILAESIERTRSESRLRDSEERFRASFEYAPIGKALESPGGQLLRVNRALSEMFGYEPDELLGATLESLAYPEDAKAGLQYRRDLLDGHIESCQFEKRYMHKTGHVICTSESLSLVLGARREPQYFIVQIQDITQRRNDEIERQQLLDGLTQRVKELTVLHKTARILELEGREVDDQLQDVVNMLHAGWPYPEVGGGRIAFDGKEYKTAGYKPSPWSRREEFRTADGRLGSVEILHLQAPPENDQGPASSKEGTLLPSLAEMLKLYLERREAWFRVAQFTRDLEQRNSELLDLQGKVSRVERLAALGQVAGSIAHDLGTPLNSILGYAQMLGQDDLPQTAKHRLNIIKTQVERMVKIINDYLARSRSPFQEHKVVNINQLIEDTLDLITPTVEQRQLRVSTSLTHSLPSIQGDMVSLQRVLINLLDNAMDAMGPGGQVTITTDVTPATDRMVPGVSIKVSDTGPGIPADLLPKIFDFFVTTKVPGKGTGMGLAVCREIVKRHEGTIKITSEAGQGTTVRLGFPLAAHQRRPEGGRVSNDHDSVRN